MTARDDNAAAVLVEGEQTAVARLVNSVLAEDHPQGLDPAEWFRIRAAVMARSSRRLWLRGGLVAAAAGSLALLIFAVARPFPGKSEAPLSYVVEGKTGRNTGFVQGKPDVGTSLVFSDGSRLHFTPHTVGRVLSSTDAGAGVLVEHGQAQFQIRHRATTEWSVYAGPFIVRVTGTQFDLSWSASERTLEVRMKEGSVVVQGPLLDGGIRLVAGQTLRAPADGGKIEVTELEHAAPIPSAPPVALKQTDRPVARAPKARSFAVSHVDRRKTSVTERSLAVAVPERAVVHDSPSLAPLATLPPAVVPPPPPVLPPAVALPPPPPLPPASPKVAAPSWAERVAAGDFEAVLTSARAGGIERSLAERPLEDLLALADAARYAGNGKLATQALLKVRARFPHAAEAKTAAFLLGRLSEQQEAHAVAVAWFDRYLEEAPQGLYAGLAFGHKMLLVGKAGARVDAEELAREYLTRYPDGAYAGAARDLLKNP